MRPKNKGGNKMNKEVMITAKQNGKILAETLSSEENIKKQTKWLKKYCKNWFDCDNPEITTKTV